MPFLFDSGSLLAVFESGPSGYRIGRPPDYASASFEAGADWKADARAGQRQAVEFGDAGVAVGEEELLHRMVAVLEQQQAGRTFAVATGVRTDVTAPALAEIFKELDGMTTRPLSAEELALAMDLELVQELEVVRKLDDVLLDAAVGGAFLALLWPRLDSPSHRLLAVLAAGW